MLNGSVYASKFSPDLYIKNYTTPFTKPTGVTRALQIAAALAAFEGVAAVNTFTFAATQVFVDGDYMIVSSPTNAYCMYIDMDGAGAARAATLVTATSLGCTALLAVSVATANLGTIGIAGVAMAAAINGTDDLTATYTAGTYILAATATRGGVRVLASSVDGIATPGTTAVEDTFGTGDWTPIGSIDEDYSVDTESEEKKGAKGETIVLFDRVTAEFSFLNLTQRNVDILKTYRGKSISMALVDLTDRDLPEIYCINDMIFNVKITPAGDAKSAPIKLTKQVKNSLTGTQFWSYESDTISA